jgi:hypothetical protein
MMYGFGDSGIDDLDPESVKLVEAMATDYITKLVRRGAGLPT